MKSLLRNLSGFKNFNPCNVQIIALSNEFLDKMDSARCLLN